MSRYLCTLVCCLDDFFLWIGGLMLMLLLLWIVLLGIFWGDWQRAYSVHDVLF